MAKKDKKTTDYVGFRAKSENQKEEFYNRAENIKEKGFSKADIFEAGLLALEEGSSEEQLQRKKKKDINERNKFLKNAVSLNRHIEALNRKLKNKPNGRYKNLDVKDNVLTIKIIDKEGNEVEF